MLKTTKVQCLPKPFGCFTLLQWSLYIYKNKFFKITNLFMEDDIHVFFRIKFFHEFCFTNSRDLLQSLQHMHSNSFVTFSFVIQIYSFCHFLYQFFALFTAYIILEIILINFWQVSAGILSHSYFTLSYKSIIHFGGFLYSSGCFFQWFWSFSIVFRSSRSLDHTIGIISWFWGHSVVNLQLCLQSLSCWKMIFQVFFL